MTMALRRTRVIVVLLCVVALAKPRGFLPGVPLRKAVPAMPGVAVALLDMPKAEAQTMDMSDPWSAAFSMLGVCMLAFSMHGFWKNGYDYRVKEEYHSAAQSGPVYQLQHEHEISQIKEAFIRQENHGPSELQLKVGNALKSFLAACNSATSRNDEEAAMNEAKLALHNFQIEAEQEATSEFYAVVLTAIIVCQLLINNSSDFRKKVNDYKERLQNVEDKDWFRVFVLILLFAFLKDHHANLDQWSQSIDDLNDSLPTLPSLPKFGQ